MQTFYSKNLRLIEPGLRPYKNDRKLAVEFACDRSRLDMLAVDRHGTLVVIEFKLMWAPTYTLGQLLGYMAVVRRNLKCRVRGVIVARVVDPELVYAAREQPRVSVGEYLPNARIEWVVSRPRSR